MGVRKNSFVVNSIIPHFPIKWEVFCEKFFKRQSCSDIDISQIRTEQRERAGQTMIANQRKRKQNVIELCVRSRQDNGIKYDARAMIR